MNPFDIEARWKMPETLTYIICNAIRLGRLRRLLTNHPIVKGEYHRVRKQWRYWSQWEGYS